MLEPGKTLEFTISGVGSMPREDQGAGAGQQSGMGAQDSGNGGQEAGPGSQPGGGIGNPINTPDPLSKYKGGFSAVWDFCWSLPRPSCCASRRPAWP